MRLARFDGGLDAAEVQFDAAVLAGNLIGFDAWSVPHCLVPFAVAFLYDSLTAGLLGAYIYESLVVLLHVAEYNLDRGADRFYPYAGAVSALIQDPLLGLIGALLGVLGASRYGPVIRKPSAAWGLFCVGLLGASAVLSEVLWEPPPSAGLFSFPILLLYLAPLWWREGSPSQDFREVAAVLLWGAALFNLACLAAYAFSQEFPALPVASGGNATSVVVSTIRGIGGSVEEVSAGKAILQTPWFWVVVGTFPTWKILTAVV